MQILELFEKKLTVDAKWVALAEDLTGYEREILRDLCTQQKRQFRAVEIKAEGPDAELEGEFSALDFFSASKVFYLQIKTNPEKWPDAGKYVWEKLVQLSDAKGNWLFAASLTDAHLSRPPIKIDNGSRCAYPEPWANYFNAALDAKLSPQKIQFLVSQNVDDILQLKHWIELWSLGGDDWATHALGWGTKRDPNVATFSPEKNLAYEWVDAALSGNKRVFLQLSGVLIERGGEDPLRLLALLGKSIKIMSQLALNEEVAGEPPFLITKLKRLKYRPELLDWWCRCDLALKSTRSDVMGLFGQIP